MAVLGKRVCTTVDGQYVYESDPQAVVLAYTQYDDVPEEVVRQLEGTKSRKAPANKARKAPANK